MLAPTQAQPRIAYDQIKDGELATPTNSQSKRESGSGTHPRRRKKAPSTHFPRPIIPSPPPADKKRTPTTSNAIGSDKEIKVPAESWRHGGISACILTPRNAELLPVTPPTAIIPPRVDPATQQKSRHGETLRQPDFIMPGEHGGCHTPERCSAASASPPVHCSM